MTVESKNLNDRRTKKRDEMLQDAVACHQACDLHKAVELYQAILKEEPNHADSLHLLGVAYAQGGDAEKACRFITRAIELRPNVAAYYGNRSQICRGLGFFDCAVSDGQKLLALSKKKDKAKAEFSLALTYLMQGNYELGWDFFESRHSKFKDELAWTNFQCPRWSGENLNGKTLFLYAEQGFGDVIQFFRYIDLINKQDAKIIFSCQEVLIPVFEAQGCVDDFINYQTAPDELDFHCPIGSLPFIFKTRLDSIPRSTGYLSLPEKQGNTFIKDGDSKMAHVGLIWSGSKKHIKNANRSISLDVFSPLFELDNVQFYSLQYGERSQDVKALGFEDDLIDLSSEINDFGDTASILDQLDLLITVDSAPAHLAGALGLPAWVLITAVPDWRWLLDREDSPWYDSIRLFRQPKPGDWKSVIENVRDALALLVQNNCDE